MPSHCHLLVVTHQPVEVDEERTLLGMLELGDAERDLDAPPSLVNNSVQERSSDRSASQLAAAQSPSKTSVQGAGTGRVATTSPTRCNIRRTIRLVFPQKHTAVDFNDVITTQTTRRLSGPK